jgi:glycerate 2-kinase
MAIQKIIKNFDKLATSKMRQDALNIIEAGLHAINTGQAIRRSVSLDGDVLKVQSRRYDLSKFERVYVIGFGKAAHDAAVELERILGKRITNGIVIDVVKNGILKRIEYVQGTHPLPSLKNVKATTRIMEKLKGFDSKTLVLTIVSGGGSALLTQPCEMKNEHLIKINEFLLECGSTIQEINTVRKHISEIKGGQFARLAHPATVVGLVFSDVPGDDLSVVASGPTVLDTTTIEDARRIIKRTGLLKNGDVPACEPVETPKDPVYFKKVQNFLLVSNQIAVKAMHDKASKLGYLARLYSRQLTGEARKVGQELVQAVRSGEALIAAGETHVVVHGNGKGGRNQELVLGALSKLKSNILISSVASDGIDNTPAAGTVADQELLDLIQKRQLDPKAALKNNDAYNFFKPLNCQIKTGKTGANVSDLMLVLRGKK